MPIFIVDKIPIHLTTKNDIALRSEIYGEENIMQSFFKGYDKNYRKKYQDVLQQKYRADKKLFIEEWVKFDMSDDEAREDISDLLYDYCAFRGTGYLSESNPETLDLLKSYDTNINYPMGEAFYINHYSTPYNLRWKLRGKKEWWLKPQLKLRELIGVVGSLEEFIIITDDKVLMCGEHFEVISKK